EFPVNTRPIRFAESAWELKAAQLLSLRPGQVACSSQGTLTALARIGLVELMDAKTGESLGSISNPDGAPLKSASLSPDRKRLSTTHTDTPELWGTAASLTRTPSRPVG